MKFKTIAEAFNYYRTKSLEEIERRAAEIKGTIERDASADIMSLNIEISGLNEAKKNLQEKQPDKESGAEQRSKSFNPVTGMTFDAPSATTNDGDIFGTVEYRNAFYKTLLGQKLTMNEMVTYRQATEIMQSEKRADAFATSTNTAAVLPTLTLNEIIGKARTMGGLISVCRSFNLPSKLSIPIATPGANAEWHTRKR